MTNEEARGIIDETLIRGKVIDEAYNYSFWEAVRFAVDKQIPKKIITETDINIGIPSYWCPNCKDGIELNNANYCNNCGQKLDWS